MPSLVFANVKTRLANLFMLVLLYIPTDPVSGQPVQQKIIENQHAQFIKLFTHEVRNRAFALSIVTDQLASEAGKPIEKFWAAYLAIEQLNQQKFKPVASRLSIPLQADLMTHVKTVSTSLLLRLAPKFAINTFRDATVKYVDELQKLEQLAPTADKAFFRYVVQQEQAQADALVQLAAGDIDGATNLLTDFFAQHV